MKVDHQVGLNESFLFPGCQGCCKLEHHCAFSVYYKIKYMNKCPCKECIVKVTCSITYCDERSQLYQESLDEDKKYKFCKEVPNE